MRQLNFLSNTTKRKASDVSNITVKKEIIPSKQKYVSDSIVYNLTGGHKPFHVYYHKGFQTDRNRADDEFLVDDKTDLNELGNEGKQLIKAIKNFQKIEKEQEKQSAKMIIFGAKEDLRNILGSQLNIRKEIIHSKEKHVSNSVVYVLTGGYKTFHVNYYPGSDAGSSDGANESFVLNNKIDLNTLGNEGKQLIKKIKNFRKTENN